MADLMRVGGLASGMNTDEIVTQLMNAERIPLNKMERDKTWLTWQRDAYRDVNKQLLDFKTKSLEMNYASSYNSKLTSSTNENVATATASSGAGNGKYNINVTQLADAAYKVSDNSISQAGNKIDASGKLSDQSFKTPFSEGKFTIKTYGKDGEKSVEFEVTNDKSLNDIMKEINDADLGLRAFYEKSSDKIMIERTETGNFNTSGNEIEFSGSNSAFLTDTLGLTTETGGNDAKFSYNNGALDITSNDNSYTLNGVTFNFQSTGSTTIDVSSDVDTALQNVKDYVESYNKIVEDLNEQVAQRKNRDYSPLTEKEKEGMEEKQIELWEEQAKKGLLYSDSVIQNGLSNMRTQWYSQVNTSGKFDLIADIGITTSKNFRDGGKLEIDEEKLREALTEDPASVQKLFTGEGNVKGLTDKLRDTVNSTTDAIERKAGNVSSGPESYTIGENIVDLQDEMDEFQNRLNKIEDRYWSQFTEMEKAIQKMNSQSQQIASFGFSNY
ncbi:flagellar hook-associated protein 2 [Pontibacillus salicampi]|uniref:Flagellar hook-associated protein 2 n=1 Tax=Pontibacillus salicampi TaxID=1449801 RepID=A0ABV6LSQ8_9BACI